MLAPETFQHFRGTGLSLDCLRPKARKRTEKAMSVSLPRQMPGLSLVKEGLDVRNSWWIRKLESGLARARLQFPWPMRRANLLLNI
jgi:hypothetical protein